MTVQSFAEKDILMKFGSNIKKARQKRNLTLEQLAKLANYDRICLAKLESGKQNIKLNTAKKLARSLNVTFAMLFVDNDSFSLKLGDVNQLEYIDDDFLGIFIANFKYSLRNNKNKQIIVYINTSLSAETVSRVNQGKVRNPMLTTLYALAFTVKKEMSFLFTRIN